MVATFYARTLYLKALSHCIVVQLSTMMQLFVALLQVSYNWKPLLPVYLAPQPTTTG